MVRAFVLPVLASGMVACSAHADGVLCALEPYLDQVDFAANPLAERDEARDIEIVDGIAYVAVDESGLQIIDVSDPSNLVLLSSLELGGQAQGISVFKGASVTLVYIACGDAGVRVVNATDPSDPTFGLVSTISLADARDVKVHSPGLGGQLTLSVAAGTEGYRAYDVTSIFPSMIEFEFGTDTARAVEVQQIGSTEFIYVATASGVDVYSEGNSTTNNLLTTISTPGARDLDYLGDVIFVANGFDGLQVIELEADRTGGVIEDNLPLGFFSARKVTVADDRLYVAGNEDDVFVIDIADPTSPGISGIIRTMGNGSCIGADGTNVLIGTRRSGVVSVDASDLAAFSTSAELGSFGWGDGNVSNVHRTAIEGSNAFVPRDSLEIFDVSTDMPVLVSSFDTGNYVEAVEVVGSIAYVVDGMNLSVIDVSNPALPDLLGDFNAVGRDVLVDDAKAYVADTAGLRVFDVSDPFGPVLLGTYTTSGSVLRVLYVGDSVFGRVAHVLTENSIDIVSLLDETTPVMLGPGITNPGKLQWNAVSDGEYVHQFIFSATTGRYMLQVVDVRNPLLPSIASETSVVHYLDGLVDSGTPAMELVDGTLSLTDGAAGLVMFDVSDPSDIKFSGVFSEWGMGAMSWTTAGDRGYLRLGGQFRVYDMSGCAVVCAADLNGDGSLNFFDVSAFLEAFIALDPVADFTGDGQFNFFDVSSFLVAFKAGCP